MKTIRDDQCSMQQPSTATLSAAEELERHIQGNKMCSTFYQVSLDFATRQAEEIDRLRSMQSAIERKCVRDMSDGRCSYPNCICLPKNVESELARLREIEHAAWHLLDDSETNGTSGEVTVLQSTFEALSSLLPEGHPGE